MLRIVRTIALSGAAAAAVLGTAATATAATPQTTTTAIETAVDRAAGTPVALPSGKTLHVRGLDSLAYRADSSHRTAVVQLAAGPAGTAPGGMAGIDGSLRQQPAQSGVGNGLQQPGYNPQQIQTQAGGGAALGTGAVLALVLGIVLFFGIKGGKVSKGWAFTSMAMGVVVAGTFIGPLVTQLGGSGVTAFGNLFGGL
ncbi:hypothetical protein SLUN_19440 [Streptomyces lunaelactis]|uniref:Integral membrane protein n=1 Tax=Streptomyces lunaelactis TaxID=1535768 RepID=A0A2R4T4J4_9ACTN|nr:hypothetical protein [Streptomyces lunaelactis]AVZ74011.1 hypothetical protein SLUN_19440 [Streptomyces lunaelactis]